MSGVRVLMARWAGLGARVAALPRAHRPAFGLPRQARGVGGGQEHRPSALWGAQAAGSSLQADGPRMPVWAVCLEPRPTQTPFLPVSSCP